MANSETKRVNRYETWHTASGDKDMRRCACWHHMTVNYAGLAFNNGWHDADKPYPHASYCGNPQK